MREFTILRSETLFMPNENQLIIPYLHYSLNDVYKLRAGNYKRKLNLYYFIPCYSIFHYNFTFVLCNAGQHSTLLSNIILS